MRLGGLDAARFAAFVGMVLVNFRIAAGVSADGGYASGFINLLEGRAAALFVVLAGIGFVLGRFDTIITLKRALFLFVLGMLNQTIFEADIIHFYALYFVVALPFTGMSGRGLLVLAGLTLLISTAALIGLDYEQGWDWDTLQYADFWSFSGFIRNSFYNGWHPVLPWIAFFFIGMWVGKMALEQSVTQKRLIIGGIVVAVLAGLLSRWLSALDPQLADLFGTSSIPPGPLYIIAASGSAVAMIGLFLQIFPMLERIGVENWLTAPGKMSLTLYIAHILLGMGLLEALGLLGGSLSNTTILTYAITFCLIAALFARAWFTKVSRGPLEGLMRKMTKG
ncbi:MAG: DUF418 domain-containing protein [Paracoccaceae bacterium]